MILVLLDPLGGELLRAVVPAGGEGRPGRLQHRLG
jgi:hypothetical protein